MLQDVEESLRLAQGDVLHEMPIAADGVLVAVVMLRGRSEVCGPPRRVDIVRDGIADSYDDGLLAKGALKPTNDVGGSEEVSIAIYYIAKMMNVSQSQPGGSLCSGGW